MSARRGAAATRFLRLASTAAALIFPRPQSARRFLFGV